MRRAVTWRHMLRHSLLLAALVAMACHDASAGGGNPHLPPERRTSVPEDVDGSSVDVTGMDVAGPLLARWVGVSGHRNEGILSLQLEVTNRLHVPVEVDAQVVCEGFVDKVLARPLSPAPIQLEPATTHVFMLAARELPIQNLEGAAQFWARIETTIVGDYRSGPFIAVTAPVFYRFAGDFASITTFDLDTLLADTAGYLVGGAVHESPSDLVGRLVDLDGGIVSVTAGDLRVVAYDEQGRALGTVDAFMIEIVADEPSGQAVAYEP